MRDKQPDYSRDGFGDEPGGGGRRGRKAIWRHHNILFLEALISSSLLTQGLGRTQLSAARTGSPAPQSRTTHKQSSAGSRQGSTAKEGHWTQNPATEPPALRWGHNLLRSPRRTERGGAAASQLDSSRQNLRVPEAAAFLPCLWISQGHVGGKSRIVNWGQSRPTLHAEVSGCPPGPFSATG